MRERLSVLRRAGAGSGGGRQGGGITPSPTGRTGAHASTVTADLVALRERIAAITARPRAISSSSPGKRGQGQGFSSPSGGGGGGGAPRCGCLRTAAKKAHHMGRSLRGGNGSPTRVTASWRPFPPA